MNFKKFSNVNFQKMEEQFISVDIQIHILEFLEPLDIYTFGITCKKALKFMNIVFKKKCVSLAKQHKDKIQTMLDDILDEQSQDKTTIESFLQNRALDETWLYYYVNISSKILNWDISEQIDIINSLPKKRAIKEFDKMLNLIIENLWIINTNRYKSFKDALQTKLLTMKDIQSVDDFYKKIFPSTYLEHFSYGLELLFSN